MNYTEYITIQERTGTIDSLGQKVETWNKFAATWAHVTTKTMSESIQASQLMAVAMKFFKIKHIAGLRADMRILYDGDYYDIIGINFDRRDNTATISALVTDNQ